MAETFVIISDLSTDDVEFYLDPRLKRPTFLSIH